MAWTAPTTFVAGDTLTHTTLNNNLYHNMRETMVYKASEAGQIFQGGGNNAVNPINVHTRYNTDVFTTSSTSYVTVTDSEIVVPMQTRCFLIWGGNIHTDANFNNRSVKLSFQIDGTIWTGSDNFSQEACGNDLTNIGFAFDGTVAIHLVGGSLSGNETVRLRARSTHGDSVSVTRWRLTVIPL